jgi:hypothetical protein
MIRTLMALAVGGGLWAASTFAAAPSPDSPDLFPQLEKVMPARERAFIDIIHDAQKAFAGARLPAAKKDVRLNMQLRIKEFWEKDPNFNDWVGVMRGGAVTREGDMWIEVAITPRLSIKTTKNRDQDPDHVTLIGHDSPLFSVITELDPGQAVTFSAKLMRFVVGSDQDMVEQPQILVHFKSLKPLTK